MAGVRENILNSATVRDQFFDAMVALDQPDSGIMASDLFNFLQANNLPLQMRGQEQEMSIYDIFVFWHVLAGSLSLAVGNGAHQGPIFLPWHRLYMIRLEQFMQQALGDPDFGLPYWDWAADGELPVQQQWLAPIWSPAYLGESRGEVRSGRCGQMRVRLVQDSQTRILWSVPPRRLQRAAGFGAPSLPDKADEARALSRTSYDNPPWNINAFGHRNELEGWLSGPQLHNRVHVWVGGDMSPGSSPNDPVFFLNHCNVDRIWEHWMIQRGRIYAPGPNQGPAGHRVNDIMIAIIGAALTPGEVLNPAEWYSYDSALVA